MRTIPFEENLIVHGHLQEIQFNRPDLGKIQMGIENFKHKDSFYQGLSSANDAGTMITQNWSIMIRKSFDLYLGKYGIAIEICSGSLRVNKVLSGKVCIDRSKIDFLSFLSPKSKMLEDSYFTFFPTDAILNDVIDSNSSEEKIEKRINTFKHLFVIRSSNLLKSTIGMIQIKTIFGLRYLAIGLIIMPIYLYVITQEKKLKNILLDLLVAVKNIKS